MIVSIDWLKDYVDFQEVPLEELAEQLTLAGLECELKISGISIPEGVVVGKVLERSAHPNADKLSVCTVDVGEDKPLNIVCGAPNVDKGQTVPVAVIGAQLAPDFVIKKSKLRGVESCGMICAEDELGLGGDHAGIMVLPDDYIAGSPFSDYFKSFKVLDIDVTPNRPDVMSHWGVVREISALTGNPVKFKKINLKEDGPDVNTLAKVSVDAPEGCPRYTARVIQDVKVGPSPQWLRDRVEAVGLRSINNVVDAANYVLMETGHPLHTFDFDKLNGHEIKVRFAEEKEKFTTLDHKDRELSSSTLMICDADHPVAIAGIMGGLDSEVEDDTKNILIESAYFEPAVIRKASKKEQLSTDASKRYERGTDPNETLVYAQDRLTEMICDLAGGTVAKGMIDVYPQPIGKHNVPLRYEYVKRVTGIEIPAETCKRTMKALGFRIVKDAPASMTVEVPSFRPDVEREIDLVEEVLRVGFMDKIPSMTKLTMSVSEEYDEFHPFITGVRNFFVGLGFCEALNNSMVNRKTAEAGIWGYDPLTVQNPLSQEMNTLRTDVSQSLLNSLKLNALKKRPTIKLFELGNVIQKNTHVETNAEEHYNMALVSCAPMWQNSWLSHDGSADFFYLKGIMDSFLSQLNFSFRLKENANHPEFDILYDVMVRKQIVGKIGQYKIDHFEKLQLEHPVAIMELELGKLYNWYNPKKHYKPIPQFPSISRDISVVLDRDTKVNPLMNEIHQNGGKYLIDLSVYDLYIDDKKLGDNKKALSFRLEFRSDEKTLTEEEISGVMDKIFKQLINKYGAQLR